MPAVIKERSHAEMVFHRRRSMRRDDSKASFAIIRHNLPDIESGSHGAMGDETRVLRSQRLLIFSVYAGDYVVNPLN